MAELRLIVLAALAGAACRASEAGTTSGLTAPSGWRALPELAKAASDAATAAKLRVDGAEAWGETSRGCYALWTAVTGSHGTPEALAEQVLASLPSTKALAGIATTDLVKPAKGAETGALSFSFAQGHYHGRVRATFAKDGAIAALTCFWNQREPAACEAGCSAFMGVPK